MTIYAHVENGAVIELRNIPDADWPTYPAELKPFMRPCVWEGEGPIETTIIEPDRVRKVRSWPPLVEIKARLIDEINAEFEAACAPILTGGPVRQMIYAEKFAQAQGVVDMGEAAANALSPTDALARFPLIAATVGIDAPDLHGVAVVVLTKSAASQRALAAKERICRAGKKAVAEAPSREAAEAARKAVAWA